MSCTGQSSRDVQESMLNRLDRSIDAEELSDMICWTRHRLRSASRPRPAANKEERVTIEGLPALRSLLKWLASVLQSATGLLERRIGLRWAQNDYCPTRLNSVLLFFAVCSDAAGRTGARERMRWSYLTLLRVLRSSSTLGRLRCDLNHHDS